MDIARLILDYLEVFAWPAVTLVVVFIFRSELKQMARSLQMVKLPGGTELDWQKSLKATEEAAHKVESSPRTIELQRQVGSLNEFIEQSKRYGLRLSPSNYDFKYYREISETDRNLSLAGIRIELEIMLQNMAKLFGIDYEGTRTSLARLTRLLQKQEILEPSDTELVLSIAHIANLAVHGQSITEVDAIRAIDASETFLDLYIPFMNGAMDQLDVEQANNQNQADA